MSYDYTQIMVQLHGNIRPATVCSPRIACRSHVPVTVCNGQRVCIAYGCKRMECRPDEKSDPDIQLAWAAIINWPGAWTIWTLLRTNPQKQYPHRKPNDKPIHQLSNLSSKHNAVHAYYYYSAVLTRDQRMPHVFNRNSVEAQYFQEHSAV